MLINNPFDPSSLMKYCQRISDMNDYEAYRTWNMGHGMLLICPSFEEVTAAATEHGIESRVVGQITDTSSITINSKGIEGASLVY